MTDLTVLQTLLVGHLWQSVALAALLALALILGRRMFGATRYSLAGVAFLAAIALPLAAFIPGESLMRTVLNQLQAPEAATPVAAPPTSPIMQAVKDSSPIANWAVDYAARQVNAATGNGAIPTSETEIGKSAIADGAPAWAIDLGGKFLQTAITPVAVEPAPKPAFVMPEFKLPNLNLNGMNIPDLTLPLLLVWAAGALFLLVRIGRDLVAVERLVARARPAELPEALKVRMAGVRVAVSTEAPGPMAAGFFKPCIVLPESIALASPGMAALLEHERAHIERSDMAIALLQRIMLALLWWSPALHWISRRMDEEREVACDERAVERTGDAKAFAHSLTKQAENQLWARAPRLAVGAIGPRSQVGRRIKRLIEIAKGAAPAKYAGRLAFAGLALAVAVAAMVTPRFSADAQQAIPPVDDALAGGPNSGDDNNDWPKRADLHDLDQLAGGPGKLDGLDPELSQLMKDINNELKFAFADLSPELKGELAGLSGEMASLGVEISSLVNQELAQEMPQIMAEVRQSLAEEGIEISDWDDLQELTGVDQDQLREALQEARDQIHEQLGPEMRAEIQQAVAQAREELASHRDEIRAAMDQKRAGMETARAAMEQARAEIEAARARGDFDKLRHLDVDIDQEVMQKLRDMNINVRDARVIHVNGKDATKEERLYRAANRGDVEAVRELINTDKANVNAVMPGDGTALIAAARRGHEDVVRVLLSSGANPNLASPGDGNALIHAARRGEVDIVRLLLDKGADPNAAVNGDGNALIAAAHYGEPAVVRLLLDRGAKVNAAVPGDGNALIAAIQGDELAIAKLLIDRGADVNAYVEGDETPLINAAEQGELDIVKFLVERGAKVNLAYNVRSWWDGSTRTALRSPLNMAVKHGRDDVADYLRSKGAVESPKAAN
ncbi:MAG TPA: ankyrin repeat domain-containing protein [Hyphomonadaceae bacterium]|nr:ankyrin repeat domain-containing protein [Hyphomonadaceae bacterium]